MAVDIAVTFPVPPVEKRVLLALVAREVDAMAPGSESYVLLTDRKELHGFSLWSAGDWNRPGGPNLMGLLQKVADQVGTLCTAWKIEHGGCAGYLIYRPGRFVERKESSRRDYRVLPAKGVEKALRRPLTWEEEGDNLLFPEILFSEDRGYRIVGGQLRKLRKAEALAVWEHDTPAEPVLPY